LQEAVGLGWDSTAFEIANLMLIIVILFFLFLLFLFFLPWRL